ncbi:LppA family lipoprotein [Mycobacterium kansasii]|uniref:LppA family lipoprotein n=1 Tax=Mycobacterium kansasii TaxID=1768 RepID=UPI001403B47D
MSSLGQAFHDAGRCTVEVDGKRNFLPDAVAVRVSVSDVWTMIVEPGRVAAAKIGATNVQVMRDQPGDHHVWFSGPTGTFIKVGYRGNLVVYGYTGCRLPARHEVVVLAERRDNLCARS